MTTTNDGKKGMSTSLLVLVLVCSVLVFVIGKLLVTLGSLSAGPPQPDAHGMIHHPVYGDYPAVVPFTEGMTIMPGQSATIQIPRTPFEFPLPPEEKGRRRGGDKEGT